MDHWLGSLGNITIVEVWYDKSGCTPVAMGALHSMVAKSNSNNSSPFALRQASVDCSPPNTNTLWLPTRFSVCPVRPTGNRIAGFLALLSSASLSAPNLDFVNSSVQKEGTLTCSCGGSEQALQVGSRSILEGSAKVGNTVAPSTSSSDSNATPPTVQVPVNTAWDVSY